MRNTHKELDFDAPLKRQFTIYIPIILFDNNKPFCHEKVESEILPFFRGGQEIIHLVKVVSTVMMLIITMVVVVKMMMMIVMIMVAMTRII